MIALFLTKKWLFPKHKGSLKDLTRIFLSMITLCSFLVILASLIIQFLQFSIFSSFVQKDFHFSFLNTRNNLEIWSSHNNNWQKQLNSPISNVFTYARQNGILVKQDIKIPIQLQLINTEFFYSFFLPYKKGTWDENMPSIVVSEEMAYQLGIHLEDILEFHFIKRNYFETEPYILKLIVTGILKDTSGNDPYLAFAPLIQLKDLFYTQLQTGILLKNIQDVPIWKKTILNDTGLRVNDVFSRHYNLLFSFQWEKTLLYFVLIIVLIISFIIIYVSFSLVFKEYKKQWSLLNMLGMRIQTLVFVFLIKTVSLVILGFSIGLTLAIGVFILYNYSIGLPSSIFFEKIIQWDGIIYLLLIEGIMSLFSFIIPIYKLYHQSILEGLKNES